MTHYAFTIKYAMRALQIAEYDLPDGRIEQFMINQTASECVGKATERFDGACHHARTALEERAVLCWGLGWRRKQHLLGATAQPGA